MLSPLRLALVVVSSVHLSHLVGGLVLPGTSRRHVVGRWASTGSRSAVRRSAWQAVQTSQEATATAALVLKVFSSSSHSSNQDLALAHRIL